MDDFDDWTNWLLYKGGVGVKGENSWEFWWEEEQACTICFPVAFLLADKGKFVSQ